MFALLSLCTPGDKAISGSEFLNHHGAAYLYILAFIINKRDIGPNGLHLEPALPLTDYLAAAVIQGNLPLEPDYIGFHVFEVLALSLSAGGHGKAECKNYKH